MKVGGSGTAAFLEVPMVEKVLEPNTPDVVCWEEAPDRNKNTVAIRICTYVRMVEGQNIIIMHKHIFYMYTGAPNLNVSIHM